MDSQRKTSILFTAILFLQSLHQAQSSPSSIPPLVKELCDKTINPTFCIETLASDSRTPKAKNATNVTEIFISIGIKDASNSRDYIDGLSKRKGLNPKDKEALEACANGYNAISFNFKSALVEVEEGELETANYGIMFSDDQVAYCQTSMAEAKIYIREIDRRLDVTVNFIKIGSKFTGKF